MTTDMDDDNFKGQWQELWRQPPRLLNHIALESVGKVREVITGGKGRLMNWTEDGDENMTKKVHPKIKCR